MLVPDLPPEEDLCAGALVGTFVGDALGMPVEGWTPERIERVHGRVDEMLVARRGAGTYTDDTQTTIALAESILEAGRVDPEHLAVRLLELHDPDRGYGRGTTTVFRHLRKGAPVDQAATRVFDGGSFGNGGAMRIAPVGVAYRDDPDALDEAAREATRVTHAHPLGVTGGLLQARAVARAARTSPDAVDPVGFVEHVAGGLTEADDPEGTWRERLETLQELLALDEPPPPGEIAEELGNDSRVFASLPAAWHAALAHADALEDALVQAVATGGDTDTIAAMAGAVSGALHGLSAVPDRWWDVLETGPRGRDHVVDLGRRLAEGPGAKN